MKRSTRTIAILLLCSLASSAISSCKKKEQKTASAEMAADTNKLRKQVKKVIDDKIRRQNVLILVDDVDRYRAELTLAWLEMSNTMQKNPTMTREEVEAEVAKFEQIRLEALRNMAKARVAMRQYITEQEWKQLFPPPKKQKQGDEQGDSPEAEAAPAEAGTEPRETSESEN